MWRLADRRCFPSSERLRCAVEVRLLLAAERGCHGEKRVEGREGKQSSSFLRAQQIWRSCKVVLRAVHTHINTHINTHSLFSLPNTQTVTVTHTKKGRRDAQREVGDWGQSWGDEEVLGWME